MTKDFISISNHTDYPSDIVDDKAFKECLFRYVQITEANELNDMRKNEVALKVASDFYREGYTKRVVDLAEKIFFRRTSFYTEEIETAKMDDRKPVVKDTSNRDRPVNKFSRYRI